MQYTKSVYDLVCNYSVWLCSRSTKMKTLEFNIYGQLFDIRYHDPCSIWGSELKGICVWAKLSAITLSVFIMEGSVGEFMVSMKVM